MAPSRRNEKGRVDILRKAARDGSPLVRAACATALHVRRMRLASGLDRDDADESEQAEAGGLIEADDAMIPTAILDRIDGYLKALSKSK